MDISREWYKSEFIQHESFIPRISIENEFNEYIMIAEGKLDEVVKRQNTESFADPNGKGQLSTDPLQNLRYHFVVATTMITRYCAMYGMELEKAYGLSDFYIQKMDKCHSVSEIVEIHNAMCYDFCKKMHDLRKASILSKPIVLCMDYIYSHIHERITLKQLAAHAKLSESYLSKLFCSEIGMPVSQYIILQKIEKARNLLSYSDYSLTDIANYLAFSSQSHFISVFQKQEGITPYQYRLKHFRNKWDSFSLSSAPVQ